MSAITVTATVTDRTGNTASATATADITTSDLGPLYVPTGGKILWGATPADMSSNAISPAKLAALESSTGRPLQAVRIFKPSCNTPWFAPGSDEKVMGAGRVVFLSVKPSPYTPDQINSGAADAVLRARAAEAQAYVAAGGKVVVTYAHESDGGPGGADMTSAQFNAGVKKFGAIFREVAPDVPLGVIFTSFANNMSWVQAAWPDGDTAMAAAVDWIGADPYTFRTSATTRVTPQSLSSMLSGFLSWAKTGTRAGKPLALTEWGCADDPTNSITDGGSGKAAWYRASAAWLRDNADGKLFKAALYYNSPGTVPTTPHDSTVPSRDAWREISNPTNYPRTVVAV